MLKKLAAVCLFLSVSSALLAVVYCPGSFLADIAPKEAMARPVPPAATPQVVEKIVKETVVVEKPVEVVVEKVVVVPATTYQVKAGDTLWDIAQAFYGDGRKWRKIAWANNIHNPKRLQIGKILTIP